MSMIKWSRSMKGKTHLEFVFDLHDFSRTIDTKLTQESLRITRDTFENYFRSAGGFQCHKGLSQNKRREK